MSSSSTNDNSNSGKLQIKPEKPKENSSQSSEYMGIPKAQAVQSYVKSVYGWLGLGTATTAATTKTSASNQASPESSSTANVTLAAPAPSRNRQIAVHPSQAANNKSYNGEPLSQSVASSSESSNNTTETAFSDLSTTPSDRTLTARQSSASNTTVTGKEKEEDSWANLKDIKSENETLIISSKSDTSISNEKPLSAPKQPTEDIQFSFLNQLRALEDEKNKEFLVPDQVYFGDREKSAQVHQPESTKMELKPQAKSVSSPIIPPIANFLSNLLPAKKPSSSTPSTDNNNNNQKE